MNIPVNKIVPNPDQPRTVFDQAELESLSKTIKKRGVILPIAVEQADDYYILVDGERRWRAAQMVGLTEIPAEIRERTNHNGIDRLTNALIANIQRADMGPVDEGRAYLRLLQELGTEQAVADEVGVSIATVSMRLALLDLPDEVQRLYNLRRLPLDQRTIAVLRRMKKAPMIRVCLRAATRGVTAKVLMRMIKVENNGEPVHTPIKREKPQIEFNGHFNALAMIAEKKIPDVIRLATINTCKACTLYPEASPSMCRECPLPDFLRRL